MGQQSFLQQIYAKVLNNVQVTVKNIHIRYEDAQSVPGVSSYQGLILQILSYRNIASIRCRDYSFQLIRRYH